jgi:hypothetical protein
LTAFAIRGYRISGGEGPAAAQVKTPPDFSGRGKGACQLPLASLGREPAAHDCNTLLIHLPRLDLIDPCYGGDLVKGLSLYGMKLYDFLNILWQSIE